MFGPSFSLVALGSGCGQAMVDNPTPAAERETTRVTLYFLAEGGTIALGVRRDIVQRTPPPWGSVASFHVGASCAGTKTVVCDRFDGLP